MRFRFIFAEKANHSVSLLCSVLEVSRSGYYASLKREPSLRAREDARLKAHVRASHRGSGNSYGSPRIHKDLVVAGEHISRKRVARLMTEEGIVVRPKRRFVTTTDSEHGFKVAPNLLRRDFSATARNQKWVGDITYLRTASGFLYLAVLMDLYSRRIVGWALSHSMETELVSRALSRAVAVNGAPQIHHTDRGIQYASHDYRKELEKYGTRASMSRKGNCWDNAVAESFFSSLKTELGEVLLGRATREVVAEAVTKYLAFYNSTRRHSSIGYVSPVDFEAAARMVRAA